MYASRKTHTKRTRMTVTLISRPRPIRERRELPSREVITVESCNPMRIKTRPLRMKSTMSHTARRRRRASECQREEGVAFKGGYHGRELQSDENKDEAVEDEIYHVPHGPATQACLGVPEIGRLPTHIQAGG